MTKQNIFNTYHLHFRSINIEGKCPLSADIDNNEARGIYAYEFTDGSWYIGKSIDVRKRHVEHLHEYKQRDTPLVLRQMLWASLPHATERQLDHAETKAIAHFERKGYQLQNVLKTNRPKGNAAIVVDTGGGFGVAIPWDRTHLPKSKKVFTFQDDASKFERFQKMQNRSDFNEVLMLLSTYVEKTIPAPADTAGLLWVATARPSTGNGSRLCCISCQNAETLVLVISNSGKKIHGYLNMKRSEDGKLPYRWKRVKGRYKTLPNCYHLFFGNLDSLAQYLKNKDVLDCCYRANAELMRRGVSLYKRFNNPYLTKAILERIEAS